MNYYEVMVARRRNQFQADLIKSKKRDALQMVVIACLCVVLVVLAI